MAAPTAWVAAGGVTPSEAAELSRLVEAYVEALEASEFDQGLRCGEAAAELAANWKSRPPAADSGRILDFRSSR